MKIQLSDHFTYGKLFRFTFPSIIMMIFTSIYSVVDGFFDSHHDADLPRDLDERSTGHALAHSNSVARARSGNGFLRHAGALPGRLHGDSVCHRTAA